VTFPDLMPAFFCTQDALQSGSEVVRYAFIQLSNEGELENDSPFLTVLSAIVSLSVYHGVRGIGASEFFVVQEILKN